MAFRLSNVTNEEALKGCSLSDLETLFAADSDFKVPREKNGQVDCKKLAELFRVPQDIPRKTANALYYIDALATPDGNDSLQDRVDEKHPKFTYDEADLCPAAYALKIWLLDAGLTKQVLAETSIENIQATDSFCGFFGKGITKIAQPQITAIERAMDRWFLANRRGTGTEITRFKRDGAFWFIVRRGDAFHRDSLIDQKTGETISNFGYRELHDIVIYDPESNVLSIHASGTKIKREYARVFGLNFFNDPDYFTPGGNITLAPLLSAKEGALNYGGIPGIHGARLTHIEYPVGNAQNEVVTHTSDDVFASFDDREMTAGGTVFAWEDISELTQATIKLQIGEVDGVLIGERSIRFTPPNRVLFKRDPAAPLIQKFMENNELLKVRRKGANA